ncbi:gp149 [Streptococcus phage Sfi11]|uniref:Gp149 n=1 Tax=Streptococcus phage Sfi11 TaxID=2681625 RepID=O80186_9CAUD|nr:gp149 [Streptococcus phage Sfi11]AAC34418.1 gp149 [Streptococcus phage Sfi11]
MVICWSTHNYAIKERKKYMKFEYESKSKEYDASGAAYATKVILKNRDGAYVPVFLPVEKIDLSNTELLKEALEVIYQENFPQRAENEKFNELDEKIKEYEALSKKATETIAKMEEASSTAQVTLMDIVDKLYEKKVLTDDELTDDKEKG